MDFLLLGSSYFKDSLEKFGQTCVWAGIHPECDIRIEENEMDLGHILARLGQKPKAVIVTDDLGRPVVPTGFEKTEILKVYYAVDTPINYFRQREFAPLFDLVLADQSHMTEKLGRHLPVEAHWLPVGVETKMYDRPAVDKKWDIGFVGAIDARVRPKRTRILDLAGQNFKLQTAGGRQDEWLSPREAASLYGRSRLVLNENLFPGVTTRMFEAMACGTMLLTESGPGLDKLFFDGRDLAVYGPDNFTSQIKKYLDDKKARRRIAAQGREKALAFHDIKNRTGTLLGLIDRARPQTGLTDRGAIFGQQGKALFWAGLRWPGHEGQYRLRRAESLLKWADKLGARDARSNLFLGILAKMNGDLKEAAQRLGLAAEAGSIRADLGLKHLSGGQALTANRHYALGRVLTAAGLDLVPGFSLYGQDRVLWTGLEHFKAALDMDPKHIETLIALGDLLAVRGAHVEAGYFFDQAAGLAPHRTDIETKALKAAQMGYSSRSARNKAA